MDILFFSPKLVFLQRTFVKKLAAGNDQVNKWNCVNIVIKQTNVNCNHWIWIHGTSGTHFSLTARRNTKFRARGTLSLLRGTYIKPSCKSWIIRMCSARFVLRVCSLYAVYMQHRILQDIEKYYFFSNLFYNYFEITIWMKRIIFS